MSTEHAKPLPFSREMDFKYEALEQVAQGLRRIVCQNPGPFTFKGTNLYVIGEGEVAVVDPGPDAEDQIDVLLDALKGETITHILVTHCHSDHSGAVAALRALTGALTVGMTRPANDASIGANGPSGRSFVVPVDFDLAIEDESRVAGSGWEAIAIHTPGHAPDHLCFFLPAQKILLSGDHVMGWNTSVIAPPEGNMGSYMRSMEQLLERKEPVIYFPGHGGPIREPQRYVKALMIHRHWRESQITDCLRSGLHTISEMVTRIYAGLDPSLSRAAALSLYAQLEFMAEKGAIITQNGGPPAMDQQFLLAS